MSWNQNWRKATEKIDGCAFTLYDTSRVSLHYYDRRGNRLFSVNRFLTCHPTVILWWPTRKPVELLYTPIARHCKLALIFMTSLLTLAINAEVGRLTWDASRTVENSPQTAIYIRV